MCKNSTAASRSLSLPLSFSPSLSLVVQQDHQDTRGEGVDTGGQPRTGPIDIPPSSPVHQHAHGKPPSA